jgi:hypothetical protein
VSRALNRHYDQMLRDEAVQDDDGTSSAQEPATSQDFLEKIFQVPFWLRRMDPTAVRLMLDGLITSDERDDHQLSADEPTQGQQAPDAATDDEPPEVIQPRPRPVADDVDEVSEPATTATATEALRIRKVERDFMDEVAPLMPRTPRAVKRFVNIYRLYKAALSPSDLDKFLDREGHQGNFRAVQVLLALVIGTPDFAKAVVKVLSTPKEPGPQQLSDLCPLLRAPGDPTSQDPTWTTMLDALETFAKDELHNLMLEQLRNVAPKVTRYSLHHMVSAPPDESTL